MKMRNRLAVLAAAAVIAVSGMAGLAAPAEASSGSFQTEAQAEKAEQKVTLVSKTAYTKYLGTSTEFALRATSNGNGRICFSSDTPRVVGVRKNGTVVFKGCGIAKISIWAEETDTYQKSEPVTVKFTVRPTMPALKSVKALSGQRAFRVTWAWTPAVDPPVKVNGFQIQYSQRADFSTREQLNVSGYKSVTKTVTQKLKKGTWYVRIRSFQKASDGSGKLYYSTWSKRTLQVVLKV